MAAQQLKHFKKQKVVFHSLQSWVGIGLASLCLVHTCHKMAPLNGTILWRHKIARLA